MASALYVVYFSSAVPFGGCLLVRLRLLGRHPVVRGQHGRFLCRARVGRWNSPTLPAAASG
ncbi:hypothetical protein ACWDA7_51155 [Streptomyces sp. NPDC001156]